MMFQQTSLVFVLANLLGWCAAPVVAQFPLNGDQNALQKMDNALVFEEKTLEREETKREGLMDRA
eukprot:7447220-Ditylum_brightwellii.AAC.1